MCIRDRQLCIELGASAPYIEDEIEHLVKNQLMKAVSGGKYQTDFVILPGRNSNIIHKIYATCFPRYYKELMAFLDDKQELLTREDFNKAGFSWERLLWVYIPLITDFALSKFKQEVCKTVVYQDIPNRPNGGKWIALGYENGTYWDDHKGNQCWKEYVPLDGPVHKFHKGFVQGFFHYWSGPDSTVFFDIPDEVFILCREIINGEIKIRNLDEEQKYLFSIAVKTRLFMKEGDTFKQNYYYIKQSEFLKATSLALELYPIILPFFDDAYRLILDAYESTIPKHLRWQMGNFLSNGLGCFVTCTLYEAYHDGKLSAPDENSKAWLSLTATDEMPL